MICVIIAVGAEMERGYGRALQAQRGLATYFITCRMVSNFIKL